VVVNTSKGAAENRRVELFLTPLAFDMAANSPSSDTTPAEEPMAAKSTATKASAPKAAPVAADDEPTK
jgi:hypothetical protein